MKESRSVLGALHLRYFQKVVRVGTALCCNTFLNCKHVMPFSRDTVTEYSLDRVDLSFTSIIKSISLSCAISSAVLIFTSCRLTSYIS